MVSSLAIGCMFFSILVIFLLPLGLAIYLYKKERYAPKALLVGALVFIVFQLLTRIPLLTVLGTQPWFQRLMSNRFFSAVLIGGLTAGIFEECGRYLGFRFFLKDKLSWGNGVAFGIGHGGIEAVSLVGTAYLNNLAFSLMINNGTYDKVIGSQLAPETAALIKEQLINTAPSMFLLGGAERLFTLGIQIALSLVVLYGVRNKRLSYLGYAILLHTLANSVAVLLTQGGVSVWLTEAVVFIMSCIALFWIKKSRELFRSQAGTV